MYCALDIQKEKEYSDTSAVFIVENDKIVRSNLRMQVNNAKNFSVAGEASYYDDYSDELYRINPNIIIFSSFSGTNEQYRHIKNVHTQMPLIKKVVLSKCVEETEFCSSVLAGVKGYCAQESELNELLRAIEIVSKGDSYCDKSMGNFIYRLIFHMNQMQQLPIDKPIEEQINLTDRELQVILAAANSDDYEDIAKKLNISKHTVKVHLTSVYRKLGVKNKLQAILKLQSKIYEFKF